ncbi:MAG: hypothetical protein ACD_24C00005G0001, partial [uncultured bacterium]
MLSSKVEKLEGEPIVEGVEIVNTITGTHSLIKCRAVFVYIGLNPDNGLAKTLGLNLDSYGSIIANNKQETNVEGVYAAGDVCGGLKHISAATGQGATAAYFAGIYLDKNISK